MYLAGTVAVGRYFYEKRARAMGMALCGAGVGMFLFTPLVRYILDQYMWRGSMFILAGIALNGCVLSSLYRPLESIVDDIESLDIHGGNVDREFELCSVHEIKDLQPNGKALSVDNMQDTLSLKLSQSKLTNDHQETKSPNGSVLIGAVVSGNNVENDCENGHVSSHLVVPLLQTVNAEIRENDLTPNGHAPPIAPGSPKTFAQHRKSRFDSHLSGSALGSTRSLRSVNMSVLSQSIFGSNASFDYMFSKRAKSKQSVQSLHKSKTSDMDQTVSLESREDSVRFSNSVIESAFPKRLVTNVNFVLMMLTCLFAGTPAFIPYSMLPDFAKTAGATHAQSAWTLSAIGIGGKYI